MSLDARRAPIALISLLIATASTAADPDVTILRAGRVIDVLAGRADPGLSIRVEGNRITEVGRDLQVPDGALVLDLTAWTLLPGLIDSHAHICLTPDYATHNPLLHKTDPYRALEGLRGARTNLLAGFTTLRDLDNEGADMADIAVRDAIRAGLFDGPRLAVSGWALSITGGHMNLTGLSPSIDRRLPQLAIMTDDRDAMVRAVRDQVKAGVDFIKIYATGTLRHIDRGTLEAMPQLSREEVVLIVEEASRWNRDVAAHAYGGAGALHAVAGGVRSIEHGMFLDDETLDLMAAKGTWWVPTMSVYLPDATTPPEDVPFREQIVARHRDTFRRAMSRGVRIAFGTDTGSMPHGEGWRELKRMADYGMPPAQVIRAATVEGAALLRREEDLGRIAPGFLADLIAVQGNPLEEIEALRRVVFVMVDGRIVRHDPDPAGSPAP